METGQRAHKVDAVAVRLGPLGAICGMRHAGCGTSSGLCCRIWDAKVYLAQEEEGTGSQLLPAWTLLDAF